MKAKPVLQSPRKVVQTKRRSLGIPSGAEGLDHSMTSVMKRQSVLNRGQLRKHSLKYGVKLTSE